MTRPPLPDLLEQIVARRRQRLRQVKEVHMVAAPDPETVERAPLLGPQRNPFLGALAGSRGRAVIAEIKLASPRLGRLDAANDPEATARAYAAAGAAALSVVVEPDFFAGSYELLADCRQASNLPVLAKDFVVDAVQLDWAAEAGADAVLLIAALHTAVELHALADEARRRRLVPVVETHDLADLGKLRGARWELVGVNNRDLHTFEVDLDHSVALASTLPTESLKIAESGISEPSHLRVLRSAGYDAFLIGEALLTAADPGAKLRELMA